MRLFNLLDFLEPTDGVFTKELDNVLGLYNAFVIGASSAQHLIAGTENSVADTEQPTRSADEVSSKVLDAGQSVHTSRVWNLTSQVRLIWGESIMYHLTGG